MNCQDMEKWILLSVTGELSPGRLSRLEAHLAGCQHCREFRARTTGIMEQVQTGIPTPEPNALVMSAIRAEAARRAPTGRVVLFRRPVVQALAYAACLAMVVGAWFHFYPEEPVVHREKTRAIVGLVSDDVLEQEETGAVQEDKEALHALARDLLIMEGLSVDEATDLNQLWESPKEGEEPSSTGIQDRSTLGLQVRGCV